MVYRVSQSAVQLFICVVAGGLLLGCADNAAPDYARCVQLNIQGDIGAAWDACNAAIVSSPTSEAGKSAAAKLLEMKPKYDIWKKAYDKKVAEEEAAKARAAAKAAAEAKRAEAKRIASLRSRVTVTRMVPYDGDCAGRGGPPHGYDYEGGTFAEDRTVAESDGCVPYFTHNDNIAFCCP